MNLRRFAIACSAVIFAASLFTPTEAKAMSAGMWCDEYLVTVRDGAGNIIVQFIAREHCTLSTGGGGGGAGTGGVGAWRGCTGTCSDPCKMTVCSAGAECPSVHACAGCCIIHNIRAVQNCGGGLECRNTHQTELEVCTFNCGSGV